MKNYMFIKRGFKMAFCLLFGGLVFGALVMFLWNWLLPNLMGFKEISFIQAVGLLALSKILFGGFHGSGSCGHQHKGEVWRKKMKSKYENMSPDERAKFKKKLEKYCNHSFCDEPLELDDETGSAESKETKE